MSTTATIDVAAANEQLKGKSAQEILKWAYDTFGNDITCANSYSIEDVALMFMIHQINPQAPIFSLDTGRLHEETYEVMEACRENIGHPVQHYFPNTEAVEQMERAKGLYSFRESVENRKECCGIRKVEPLKRALSGKKAWIVGLRREQAVTRADMNPVEIDNGMGGIIKVSPLIEWTHEQTLAFTKDNNLPYNKLYDRNFPSIGCSPCTRAIQPGEDLRAGRWWWENPETKECGLHQRS